ncbi:MAG: nucleotide exchange factor GrpE [Verrucomicrobiaceae bacterium]|nr:nucleotide exchange factor GrpE [Verrucomicrobiaceae bacterium]
MTVPSPDPATQPIPESIPPVTDIPAEAPPPADPAPEAASQDPIALLTAEVDRWKDLAYRSQAELDNFRKRSAREAQDTRAYANSSLLTALLPILDNFEMGLDAARAESEKSMIYMGMAMVQRQLADFLRDMGVTEIEALGKPFDPNLHDAVSTEAAPGQPEGTILRVTRRGFRLKDRLLRPSSVIVAGTPPAA